MSTAETTCCEAIHVMTKKCVWRQTMLNRGMHKSFPDIKGSGYTMTIWHCKFALHSPFSGQQTFICQLFFETTDGVHYIVRHSVCMISR